MSIREKIKPNVLYIATMGAALASAFVGVGAYMASSAGTTPPVLVVASITVMFTGAIAIGGALLALAGQVASNDPPNHVQAVLDHADKTNEHMMATFTVNDEPE